MIDSSVEIENASYITEILTPANFYRIQIYTRGLDKYKNLFKSRVDHIIVHFVEELQNSLQRHTSYYKFNYHLFLSIYDGDFLPGFDLAKSL